MGVEKATERTLQKLLEFFDCQASVPDNSGHCVGVDRIASGDSNEVASIRHHYVLSSFPGNLKPQFFQCAHRLTVIDSGNFGHERLYCDFNFAILFVLESVQHRGLIVLNGFDDVCHGFLFRLSLGPAPR